MANAGQTPPLSEVEGVTSRRLERAANFRPEETREREREADREGAGLGRKEGKGFRRGTTRVKRYTGD